MEWEEDSSYADSLIIVLPKEKDKRLPRFRCVPIQIGTIKKEHEG